MKLYPISYDYRWFDTMLLVEPIYSNTKALYLPSSVIFNLVSDGKVIKRYYCYDHIINEFADKKVPITDLQYGEYKGIIDCDGIVTSITFCLDKKMQNQFTGDYWYKVNDPHIIDEQRRNESWKGLADAFSTIQKNTKNENTNKKADLK